MLNQRLSIVCAFLAGLWMCGGSLPAADAKDKLPRILMVTQSKGFTHGSVRRDKDQLSPAEVAVTQIGQTSGVFTVDCTQNAPKDFTIENLKNYDIVWFYTTGPKDKVGIPDATLDYFFNDWLKQPGHGFVGTHSATDTYGDYKPYWDMIGGTFNGHPWGSGETVTVSVLDPNFPADKVWGDEFQIKDEIYQYKNWQPEKVHVLMVLNMAKCKTKRPYMVPVSWVKDYGKGKVFYTNLGHNPETWANKKFQESLLHGVKWVLGQEPGDATPNPEVSAAQEKKAKADFEAATPAAK